ncbi:hypothetical protein K438DRAFT_1800206 [Mycena galopus ATCC 62051]|nr:hypothetical protein K438DRAFT_1800206 [Mycena galopus ATCC 62051]
MQLIILCGEWKHRAAGRAFPSMAGVQKDHLSFAFLVTFQIIMSSSTNLITLAPELKLSVISQLPISKKSQLRLVCQIFNKLLILDLPLEQLRVAQKKNPIFPVEGAKKGDLGFDLFIINTRGPW